MGRKVRWQTGKCDFEADEMVERKNYRAASYIRLSGRDSRDSMAHQKAVIWEYVKKQTDIQIVAEFEDCNRSGTNFCRTGFISLMAAVERREVDCVIVKDLSRFGRNLQEVSEYLELVFPRLGVRFLSISDQYDSENPMCLGETFFLPIRCLLDERYAKDISRKVSATVELMQKNGRVFGSVPYGYQREKNEVKVTEASKVVQQIYQMALTGVGNRGIASELDRWGYTTPLEYQRTKVLVKGGESSKELWQTSSVERILKNIAYTGMGVCHKSKQCFYKEEKRRKIAEEEWIYIDHAYPEIITRDIFERVQEIRYKNKKRWGS